MIKTKLNGFDVLSSGTIINPKGEIITMTLGENDELTFEFQFIQDEEKKERKLEAYQPDNNKSFGIKFLNFKNNINGNGNKEPIQLGWISGRELLLNFRIISINGNNGLSFEFTWLLGKNKSIENEE